MSEPPADPDPASLRASDKDRESAAEVLRVAAGDGRLNMTELDERLEAVYEAKTYAELEPIIRDLPHRVIAPAAPASPESPVSSAVEPPAGKPSSGSAVAVMSGFSRKGAWVVPADFTAVQVTGVGLLGVFEHGPTGAGRPGGPKIHIGGVAFWGAVDVRRKPYQSGRKQRELQAERQRLEPGHPEEA